MGKALINYLMELGVNLQKVPNIRVRKSSYERSKEDIQKGRVITFASAEDMCNALGI